MQDFPPSVLRVPARQMRLNILSAPAREFAARTCVFLPGGLSTIMFYRPNTLLYRVLLFGLAGILLAQLGWQSTLHHD